MAENKGVIVTLLFPKTEKFDMDYFVTKHMPKAAEHFKNHGFQKYEVVAAQPGADYSTLCFIYFETKEGAEKAFATAEHVLADIPNYTDVKPISVAGRHVASG